MPKSFLITFLILIVLPPTTKALFFQLTWFINHTVSPLGSRQSGMDRRTPKPSSSTQRF
jgi:hypothetical protein